MAKTGDKGNTKNKKGLSTKTQMIIAIIMALAGLFILGRMVVLDWMAEYEAANTIQRMTDSYDPLDDPELVALRKNAEAYNARMGGITVPADMNILPYEEQLRFRDTSEMSWVSIPKIDVAIPVYHGTEDSILAKGVGHLEDSSLPVGGESSHSVLTGHSGMAGNRMFDDLRRLEVGDIFVVHTLGMPYAYKVYGVEVVWPHERDSLEIEPGLDRCTLVTCTPLGVNDHRLLVHGERVEYDPSMEPTNLPYISPVNIRTIPLFIAIGAILLAVVIGAVWNRRRKKNLERKLAAAKEEAGLDAASRDKLAEKRAAVRKAKAKNRILTLVGIIMIIAGILVLSSSVIMDWYETYLSEKTVSEMVDASDTMPEADKRKLLEQANAYNAYLRGAELDNVPNLWNYNEQLDYDASHIMSYVNIPKTNTKLPIRHGTSEDTLMTSVGHIENSSLPVGGPSTHCVISGHSGMAMTRMFDDIYKLEQGDVIVLWTLGEPLAYKVYDTEVVKPDEVGSLSIQRDRDLLTLVTCTPYGINSHRLLVHAERCDYDPAMESVPATAYVNYRTVPFLLGILVGIPALVILIVHRRRADKRWLESELEKAGQ